MTSDGDSPFHQAIALVTAVRGASEDEVRMVLPRLVEQYLGSEPPSDRLEDILVSNAKRFENLALIFAGLVALGVRLVDRVEALGDEPGEDVLAEMALEADEDAR